MLYRYQLRLFLSTHMHVVRSSYIGALHSVEVLRECHRVPMYSSIPKRAEQNRKLWLMHMKRHLKVICFQHPLRRHRGLHVAVVSVLGPGAGQAAQRALRKIRPARQREFELGQPLECRQ